MKVRQIIKEYPILRESEVVYVGMIRGNSVVESITYHEPMGEGDAHYCDVFYSNGSCDRIFKPDSIEFVKESSL
jgi:hypothetical protein